MYTNIVDINQSVNYIPTSSNERTFFNMNTCTEVCVCGGRHVVESMLIKSYHHSPNFINEQVGDLRIELSE